MSLYFDPNDSLSTIIKRVREQHSDQVELRIPQDSVVWQNSFNQIILREFARLAGKKISFGEEAAAPPMTTVKLPAKPQPTPVAAPSVSKAGIILLGFFVVFLGASLAYLYFYLPKATVVLYVEEKTLEKEEIVRVDTQIAKINFEQRTIPGQVLESEASDSEKFEATGKKTVGDKAIGKLTLQNWTDNEITLPAKELFTVDKDQEGAGLVYESTQEVTIPAQTFSIPGPGQKLFQAGLATVQLKASEIGETFNLPAGVNFIVDKYPFSSLGATNPDKITGGSTREVTAVSQENLQTAQDQLSSKLFTKSKDDLKSRLMGDQKLIEAAIVNRVESSQFSHQANEEADNFTVSLKTRSIVTVYSESQLKEVLSSVARESVPPGFSLLPEKEAFSSEIIKSGEKGSIELLGKIKTLVVPDFDTQKIKEQLVGKKSAEAKAILTALPRLSGSEIHLWPLVPPLLQTLPFQKERLTIKIETR